MRWVFVALLVGAAVAAGGQSPLTHYRSIGVDGGVLHASGVASVAVGSTTVVVSGGAPLPARVGRGDKLTLDPGGSGEEVLFILSRDTDSQVTLQSPATADHLDSIYTITRAFSSLQDWEDARQGDLVRENRVEVGVLYDGSPFTLPEADRIVKVDGSTTDAQHFLSLTVAEGRRHQGLAGSGVLLDGAGSTKHGLRIEDDYTHVEGLAFARFRGANGAAAVEVKEARGVLLESLLVYDFYDPGFSVVGIKGSDASDFTVRNSIIYDGDSAAIRINQEASTATIESCTIWRMRDGRGVWEDDGTVEVHNTISLENLKQDFQVARGTQSYNLSSDDTASGSGSQNGAAAMWEFVSVVAGTEDLHLRAGAVAIDSGRDLSSRFAGDIDDENRPIGEAWEIGADESAGSTDVVEPPPGPSLADFTLYADDLVKLEAIADSLGSVGSNRKIEVEEGASGTVAGDLRALGEIEVDGRIRVDGDVVTNEEVDIDDGGSLQVSGEIVEGASLLPLPLPTLSFSAGGEDLEIEGTMALPPGSYGEVEVEEGATLELTSGDYFFDELDTESGARIVIVLTSAPITVNTVDDLDFDESVEVEIVSGSSRDVTFNFLGDGKVELEPGAVVRGTIVAPQAKVKLEDGSRLEGTCFAHEISLDEGASFVAPEPSIPGDQTPPTLAITSPARGSFVSTTRPDIAVSFSDDREVDTASLTFTANGSGLDVSCQLGILGGRCTPVAALPEGSIDLTATIRDLAGNSASDSVIFSVDTLGVEISIDSPPDGFITRSEEIDVTGTLGPGVSQVRVNGAPATVAGSSFAARVPLREGTHMAVAVGLKANGNSGSASVELTRDIAPPIVRIQSPRDGFVSLNPTIAVTGVVNDVVTGGVRPTVRVNGVLATAADGSFMVPVLPLRRGPNEIQAIAMDAVGNVGRHSITVVFQPPTGARIRVASGNGQTGFVNEILSDPLVAVVQDDAGNPLAGRMVRFEVTRNSGGLQASFGDEAVRRLELPTDATGQAAVLLTLGDAAGEGNNRVRATVVGLAGEVEFCASGLPTTADRILMNEGDNQRGQVGRPLPLPLEALVVDREGNPIAGTDVTFEVIQGGGSLDGQKAVVRTTGTEGIARAVLTLGQEPGINNNVVRATFPGIEGLAASFTASGLAPGDPAETGLGGVVLDNGQSPIPGARVRIEDTALETFTDDQGQFLLNGVPVGHVHLIIDPSSSPRPETFPSLAFETVTVAGQKNTIGQPILIPALDTEGSKIVGGGEDVTLVMSQVEGLSLTIFANSVTFPDGSTTGRVSISQVHLDKVPMPPPGGSLFFPAWTIQPAGVAFDPPAAVTIPNPGLPPGRIVDIFQFDHTLNEFIGVGKGTVSNDGSIIASDPGFGVTRAGWGGARQPPPPPTETVGPECPLTNFIPPIPVPDPVFTEKHVPSGQGDGRFGDQFRRDGQGQPKMHLGVDVPCRTGELVFPAAIGFVARATCSGESGYGNRVEIRHLDGTVTEYGHLLFCEKDNLSKGDPVTPILPIGTCDASGNAKNVKQPHLHFEIREKGAWSEENNFLVQDPTACFFGR